MIDTCPYWMDISEINGRKGFKQEKTEDINKKHPNPFYLLNHSFLPQKYRFKSKKGLGL